MTYGNEWINYSQKYYKIQVPATGIYRLDQSYLQAAGISGVDPRKFQLFRRGQEVAIHVAGESDGSLDNGDYIEFYGEQNDGALDRELYQDPVANHINALKSQYTDTAAYFLTWSAVDGKRMEAFSQSAAGLTPEPWHWQETPIFDEFEFVWGKQYGGAFMSWMDAGEGLLGGSTAGFTFNLPNMATNLYNGPGAGAPSVEIALGGANDNIHDIDIYVRPPGGAERRIGTERLVGYESFKKKFPLAVTDFGANGSLALRITARNSASRYRTSYFKTYFPQKNIMASAGGLPFKYEGNPTAPLYFVFDGTAAANAIAYDITSMGNIKRVEGVVAGAQKGFVLPASFKSGYLWSATSLVPLPAKAVMFKSVAGNKADYLIVSHKNLMVPFGESTNAVKDYAAYRASIPGGGHDTLVMDVDQIYNQFFYGEKSPAAIRRFIKMMVATGNPKFLFLIGKGIEYRTKAVRNAPQADLVPTGGNPGSDIFYTANWELGEYFPVVATGRIAATQPQQILDYLTKVKAHESLPQNLEWRKNILHLGGGIDGPERTMLANYLKGFERIAEGKWLGARVTTKLKSSIAGDIENINIADELNKGLSMVTFFGHSSTSFSDLEIGLVSNVLNGYKNKDKYPFILMNGCEAGNSFVQAKSFGEDWLLTPDKGAIGFLAHVHAGLPPLLNVFSTNFYNAVFANEASFGKTVGEQHALTIKNTSSVLNIGAAKAMYMQMVLQADPAVVIVGPEKADYAVAEGGISVQPIGEEKVTANSEKFSLLVDIKNLGKVNTDSFYVLVNRTLTNGTVLKDSMKVAPIYYRDTVAFELAGNLANSAGINKFEVIIDHDQKIPELDEANNTATYEYFMSQSGVIAVGPQEFSIVTKGNVKLIGQSTNLLMAPRDYYFEIDTASTFDSPWKKSQVVSSASVPTWEVALPEVNGGDSVVYFWRFKYNTLGPDEEEIWANSSFRYIPNGSEGWSQARFAQTSKGELTKLLVAPGEKKFDFAPLFKRIEMRSGGGQHKMSFTAPYGIFIDGSSFIWDNCGFNNPNIYAIVFNDVTLDPYTKMPAGTGALCGFDTNVIYQFTNLGAATYRDRLQAFLKTIPEGYYVAIVGINNVPYSTFSSSLKEAFKGIGSKLIDDLKTGDPFAILGRKGSASGTALEQGANPDDLTTPRDLQMVRLEKQLQVHGREGSLTSNLIGPSNQWKTLMHQVQTSGADIYGVDIIGVTLDGEEEELYYDISAKSYDISGIDAKVFPYLKLRVNMKDTEQRTAPLLKEWTVLYNAVPEGIMRPDLAGLEKINTISEQATNGKIDLRLAFQNVSETDFSGDVSIETTLLMEDGTSTTNLTKVGTLEKNDTIYFNYTLPTLNMKGTHRLRFTWNPKLLPEQNYNNNILEIPFTVSQVAGMPPVLDVVFDGTHILDQDIVSPNPVINMMLKDNNRKILITDPSSMEVFLKRPTGPNFEEIAINNNPEVKWFPADEKNDFRVEFQPKDLEDGMYTLEVQGKDATGQKAASERYRINFLVVNESSISNFFPYPNPFSSKTRFVFTLTGNFIPERFKIQIMTVTGKVVKEIQRDELGPLKIGNNMTEYAWDGTDEYGDRLANGVYLYRVIMDQGPEEMKKRSVNGDRAFKNGYGKIYILR
ncbi:hypothetical protein GU926_05980 [Nibribacter ruber]|uniref:Gingipain domain-containing protein n=1 Tax=Nibribacter ruber TaxID=2698458 RepID=A0A6P1NTG1_9BACT|nr:C25 family cysteine peptidase [Nibribacter ruber]QHL87007.1 hypothetical protein GU926_05980 [Nibribacter ruber]